jgi:hypothetical protein
MRTASVLAGVAAALGLAYAMVSAYWASGGTVLLDTVGGSLERAGRTGDAVVILGLWAVVVLKLIAAALPAWAITPPTSGRVKFAVWRLALIEATVLTGYGFVLTAAGLLVHFGVISSGARADRRALAWHAFVWDPWFLIWGLAVAAAIHQARRARSSGSALPPASPTGA